MSCNLKCGPWDNSSGITWEFVGNAESLALSRLTGLGIGNLMKPLDDLWGFQDGSVVKNPSANEGDVGSILGLGRSPGKGNGNPLQYCCLENPMDGERNLEGYSPWDHKSWTQLNNNKSFTSSKSTVTHRS